MVIEMLLSGYLQESFSQTAYNVNVYIVFGNYYGFRYWRAVLTGCVPCFQGRTPCGLVVCLAKPWTINRVHGYNASCARLSAGSRPQIPRKRPRNERGPIHLIQTTRWGGQMITSLTLSKIRIVKNPMLTVTLTGA